MAVSKLTSEVTENYWETKGMKHALRAEKDYNDTTSLKLQRLQVGTLTLFRSFVRPPYFDLFYAGLLFQDSTARQMEDLAQEVDKLRRSAR
jgi:hypothetical protein